MPAKHQPDLIYLRHVPLRKVHLFTVIQLSCLLLLWTIKTSKAAIVFPMMVCEDFLHTEQQRPGSPENSSFLCALQVLALVFIRKLMDCFFTKREMGWLDDLMPENKKKILEDEEVEMKQRSI